MVQRVQEALNAALAGDEEDIQFAAPELLPDFNQKHDEDEVSSSSAQHPRPPTLLSFSASPVRSLTHVVLLLIKRTSSYPQSRARPKSAMRKKSSNGAKARPSTASRRRRERR